MEKNFDRILVKKIIEGIPSKIVPVDFLMGLLGLSRDAVYRRLSCKTSFSCRELQKLSSELDFSVDEIIKQTNSDSNENAEAGSRQGIEQATIDMISHIIALLKKYNQANHAEMLVAVNRLLIIFTYEHCFLFRFLYYKWKHLMREVPVDFPLSEIVVPDNVLAMRSEYMKLSDTLQNVTFMFDSQIYLSIIRDIQYYYKRNLITDLEMDEFKESMYFSIGSAKKMMIDPRLNPAHKSHFYLSTLNINSNTVYSAYDGIIETIVWSFSPRPIYISDQNLCAVHREWLECQKRYSALLTGANEGIMLDFLKKQYEYVRDMDTVFYI